MSETLGARLVYLDLRPRDVPDPLALPRETPPLRVGDVFDPLVLPHETPPLRVGDVFDPLVLPHELHASAGGGPAGAPEEWFHEVRWPPRAPAAPGPRAAGPGPWLIFADRGGVAERIAARRAAGGERTVLVAEGTAWSLDGDRATVRPGEAGDYRQLIEAAGGPAAVVHFWDVECLLHLLHALLAAGARPRPRLWLVTAGAQAVAAGDRCDAPTGATIWGLGRSLAAEHAELWGGLVDVAPGAAPDASAEQLCREVAAGDAEDKVAFREGKRYAARLLRRERRRRGGDEHEHEHENEHENEHEREYRARSDGTYLVTGGLGGIGLAMARWLVERGARHLLLVGRTARRTAAVEALETPGARVEVAALDIAREGGLEACLAARRARGEPPVRGVIHAAGILRFVALADLDTATLRALLAAKVEGAWRLHRLLRDEPLDLFVLCSSSSALLGSPLLGGYAAGNAFLDALAHHRRGLGLPALSVNWGTWGEVGMAVEAGRGAAGGPLLRGLATIPTACGLAALRELVEAGDAQAAVLPVDWPEVARAYPAFAADRFFEALVGEAGAERPEPESPPALTLAKLRAAPAAERPAALQPYLRAEAARVLGLAADRLDPAMPLSALGLDSLMAVQLKNRIETDLGLVVPMVQFLQGPSVEELALAVSAAAAEAATGEVGARAAAGAEAWEEGSL